MSAISYRPLQKNRRWLVLLLFLLLGGLVLILHLLNALDVVSLGGFFDSSSKDASGTLTFMDKILHKTAPGSEADKSATGETESHTNNLTSGKEDSESNKTTCEPSEVSLKVHSQPRFNVAQKIFYFSRHYGTTADFKFMADALQLENVTYMDAGEHFNFISDKSAYKSILDSGLVEDVCSQYDIIVISDSLADGWGFIMGDSPRCKNIVFVTTNRFDYGIRGGDKEQFFSDFNAALNRNDEYRARLIVNNPFEVEYCKDRKIEIPEDCRLIRPFGNTDIEAKSNEGKNPSCMILGTVAQDHTLLYNLIKDKIGIECLKFAKHYGGPRSLSQYDSIVVHLPYQVSIMKMWENLAYGVLMAIPSPKFYVDLCNEHECHQQADVKTAIDLIGDEWYKYSDFYLPGWENCVLQFESWDHLKEILEKKDYQKNINLCRDKMMGLRASELRAWKEFLIELQE